MLSLSFYIYVCIISSVNPLETVHCCDNVHTVICSRPLSISCIDGNMSSHSEDFASELLEKVEEICYRSTKGFTKVDTR